MSKLWSNDGRWDDVTVSALISESDWLRLRAALRHMDEISLERSLGAVRVQASTARVKKAWPVAMVVGLAVEYPGGSQRQYFQTIKAAREAAEGWRIYG